MAERRYSAKEREQRIKEVARGVLPYVKPSDKERGLALVRINQIMGRLKQVAPRKAEIVVAGSFARGTNLRGDSDVDIFLLFPKSVPKENMERIALEIAKKVTKSHRNESYTMKYAEHPYVRLLLGDIGMNVDVVPAYKIRSADEMGTAVDRTQLHNEFVRSRLSGSHRDDVLVLKSFLKAHSIYGADARTEGFSGYLCELLIIHYGTFAQLLEAMANAKAAIAIRVGEKADQAETAVLVKRFSKNFVVIDPTDDNRNVAANVSLESFARLALAARRFIADPSKRTFYGIAHSERHAAAGLARVRKQMGSAMGLYAICFGIAKGVSEEIIWQQLKRLRIRLEGALAKRGFAPVLSIQEVGDGEAVIGIFTNDTEIAYKISKGPSALSAGASESFWKAHKNALFFSLESERIYAVERSELAKPMHVLRAELNGHDLLPSYLSARRMKIYRNKIPERLAKMIYRAYAIKTEV
jgi:tRNA nucleotidyltransferase (CCA-adding enzyme)